MKDMYLVFLLFITCLISSNAQTMTQREDIIGTYNKNSIRELTKNVNSSYLAKQDRIEFFLKSNRVAPRKLVKGKQTYYLFDIYKGKPIYATTHNKISSKVTKTDQLHSTSLLGYNLDGENMSIGVWDGESALGTHVEFKDDQASPESRIVYAEYPNGVFGGLISEHATHVAGTIAAKGVDKDAKGMAPKARIISYDFDRVLPETIEEASNGLLLANHSWGTPIFLADGTQQFDDEDIGAYTSTSKDWDDIAYATPYYLEVRAAGNEGTKSYSGGLGSGYDKLTGSRTSKNNLVVASAITNFSETTGVLQFFARSSFSSQGPTDDFRIKPDIAGRGENVFSCGSSFDTAYTTLDGTSMATPNVSGSLVLLQEYYNQLNGAFGRAATLKALICHTAIDDSAKPGPDPFLGWGLLDAKASADVIKQDIDGAAVISELSLANGESYTYQFSSLAGAEIKATICWTDPAGTIQSNSLNDPTPRLVNDLDLRLIDSNSNTSMPWKLNTSNISGNAVKGDNVVDNIERIDINSAASGIYSLIVSHKGTLTNGSQDFSLIVTGSNITLSNPKSVKNDFILWPNPVENLLNLKGIQSNKIESMYVFDMQGREINFDHVKFNNSDNNCQLDVSSLQSGLYVIVISHGSFIKKYKFLKQ